MLGKGYTAGVGMSIGTAFGRIAGTNAAKAALEQNSLQRSSIKRQQPQNRANHASA